VTQAMGHHGAELELDSFWHAKPMKFVAYFHVPIIIFL